MKKKEEHKTAYKIFKAILLTLFKWYYRPVIINKENIPEEGPILLCGNHIHVFDQNFACLATKRMLHYMAKKEYFDDKKVAWFFKSVGCIPVNRQIHDTAAKNHALELLNDGYAVGLFPEGTRNKTDEFLLPFKFGAVSMAQKTGAKIVPFAVTGEYKFKNNHLNARFGKPFAVPKDMDLEEANKKLFNEISKLKKSVLEDIKKGKI